MERLKEIQCPNCGRFLFEASDERSGTFRVMCRSRQCRQPITFRWGSPASRIRPESPQAA